MKKCPYCKTSFTPHVKVVARQKTCGSPECKKALKSENNKRWRRKNADCCQNDYPRVKEWLEQNPGYLKKYRQGHPEYVRKNREAQRVRDRSKKLRLDIQAQLNIKPIEITFLFSSLPCLDIQVQLDSPFGLKDNSGILTRRDCLCT